jgi:hypothetical protein
MVFLNTRLPPQRGQGLWWIWVGSTASSWCRRKRKSRTTITYKWQLVCQLLPLKAHSVAPRVAIKAIWRCLNRAIGSICRVGTPMTIQNDDDHHSDYRPAQLALFVAAAIVLLVFAWTYVH